MSVVAAPQIIWSSVAIYLRTCSDGCRLPDQRRICMVDAPVKIVVVYHSGYDHTARMGEAVARGAAAISGARVVLVTAEEAPGQWCIGVQNLIKRSEAYA